MKIGLTFFIASELQVEKSDVSHDEAERLQAVRANAGHVQLAASLRRIRRRLLRRQRFSGACLLYHSFFYLIP